MYLTLTGPARLPEGGDDLQTFAGLLGEEIICGVREHADQLANQNTIKAVVSRRAEFLDMLSLVRGSEHFLLMPRTAFAGDKACFRYCMREACNAALYTWLALFLVCLSCWIFRIWRGIS